MELSLPHGGEATPQYANVTKRMRDRNGLPIGTANDNPILDMRMYEVEFLDGTKTSLSSSYTAENLFVGSVRLSFIVASSFSESRKRMAGEELSLFTANLNVKVVPGRFMHSVRLTNNLIVVSIICVL